MSQRHNVTPVAIVDTMDESDEDNDCGLGIFYINIFAYIIYRGPVGKWELGFACF
jgi:hypothetical protein